MSLALNPSFAAEPAEWPWTRPFARAPFSILTCTVPASGAVTRIPPADVPARARGGGGWGGAGAGRRECAGAVVIAPAFLASAPDRRSAHRGLPVMCLTGSRQDLHRLCTQTQVMGIC